MLNRGQDISPHKMCALEEKRNLAPGIQAFTNNATEMQD